MKKLMVPLVIPAIALTLTGCWTPPNANVQPAGEPRLIQNAIPVESVIGPATVLAVDPGQRNLVLQLSDGTTLNCKVGPKVGNFDQVQGSDTVKVTLAQELSVYVLKNGRLPGANGTEATIHASARVQSVDPSYRLLTLQYPDGRTQVIKTGLDTKLSAMAPGDDVVVQTTEAKAIRIEKQ